MCSSSYTTLPSRFLDPRGRLINVIGLDTADGAVRAVRSVINPDKLAHVGPLSPGAARPAGTGPERARPAA
jgi:RNA polymerase sigma-70 factor (ECF subfamily)